MVGHLRYADVERILCHRDKSVFLFASLWTKGTAVQDVLLVYAIESSPVFGWSVPPPGPPPYPPFPGLPGLPGPSA